MTDTTAVIINFKTPDLTERAVESLRSFYPLLPLLLIDNGSGDESQAVLRRLQESSPGCTQVILNDINHHHGPAMDQALRQTKSSIIWFLDSDCEVMKPGVLEGMLELMKSRPESYVVGKRIFMNDRGYDAAESPGTHPYIRPICMLVRREKYLSLPPFERHGAPCLRNMIAAGERGFALLHFPVEEFVHHKGRGTASRHGYHLGWRGRLNHLLNRLGL